MPRSPKRVFLSHTSELRDWPKKQSFVAAAEEAVNRAQNSVTDMEYFTARDQKPAAFCQAEVGKCDIYVGIIGFRYGTPVRDRSDISYVQLEFEMATKLGKPRLCFLLDEEAEGCPRAVFHDPKYADRQDALRESLKDTGIQTSKFRTPDDLKVKLLQALQELPGLPPSTTQEDQAQPLDAGKADEAVKDVIDSVSGGGEGGREPSLSALRGGTQYPMVILKPPGRERPGTARGIPLTFENAGEVAALGIDVRLNGKRIAGLASLSPHAQEIIYRHLREIIDGVRRINVDAWELLYRDAGGMAYRTWAYCIADASGSWWLPSATFKIESITSRGSNQLFPPLGSQ
ncbi:MAG: DUF4062 domain-containing protein [Planctomycetota bacterium]|nr:DUF4062 domain-containing protein [Planctomycetota bacterium]